MKFPVLVSHNLKIANIHKGAIHVPDNAKMFCIKLGIEGVPGVTCDRKGFIMLDKDAVISFAGTASLSKGISIRSSGNIYFGDKFYCNCNMTIICAKQIMFGDDCVLGWNINIRDTDGHKIMSEDGMLINPPKDVVIGNHVWIGQDVSILKGSVIPDNSVLAMKGLIAGRFSEENTIIGGFPATVIKRNVNWKV